MSSTFKCSKCAEIVRFSCQSELDEYIQEHKKICSGKFESVWKNYDKMTREEKDTMAKAVMFRHGKITE